MAAELPMGIIKSLFDIERLAQTLPEAEHLDLRQRLAKPKVQTLKTWLDQAKLTALPMQILAKSITNSERSRSVVLVMASRL